MPVAQPQPQPQQYLMVEQPQTYQQVPPALAYQYAPPQPQYYDTPLPVIDERGVPAQGVYRAQSFYEAPPSYQPRIQRAHTIAYRQ